VVTVFVDTSAVIAHLDAEDRRHAEASATLDWLRGAATLVTTNYVEVECLAVCRRRLGREAAIVLVDELMPVLEVIWVTPQIHAVAIAAYRSGRNATSLVDEVSFAVMRSRGISEAFAYDGDFDREGFKRAAHPNTQDRVHEEPAPYGDDLASDLVSVTEIAARAGRPINTIQSWRRRHADFPAPMAQLGAGPIWSWPQIEGWLAARARTSRASGRVVAGGR
jgi:uncharacterized protein